MLRRGTGPFMATTTTTTAVLLGAKRKRTASTSKKRHKRQKVVMMVIYTDGACKGNNRRQGVGAERRAGYGIFYGDGDARNVARRLRGPQTNNRAEMQAIIDVCELHKNERVEIRTDSQYCKDVVTKWMAGWRRRGWKKADGKTPLNLDMVKRLYRLIHEDMSQKPVFTWVKGHASDPGNIEADRLANKGALMSVSE